MTAEHLIDRRRMLATGVGVIGGSILGGSVAPVFAADAAADDDAWIQLFDGKSLDGWHKNPEKIGHGTGGHWHVEPGGVLAGEQDPPGSGNGGILLTDRKFENFELELDIKPSWGVDSGIFLRSTDRGQCIQMTVDYYNGGNIGHFYGEATGGWVARAFSIEGVEEDGKLVRLKAIGVRPPEEVGLVSSCTPDEWLDAWKIDDWNAVRVRVEGGKYPKITTALNGLEVGVFDAANSDADGYDREAVAQTLGGEGHIAVQVHGGGSYPAGKKCRWRNIRVREL
ncbi:MAG: hypothetical protein DCC67_16485 [Planctomycetota bacterium]|nr:MAG: hypothetical protein DCC67_16485 [Planctomycetota bacterium]